MVERSFLDQMEASTKGAIIQKRLLSDEQIDKLLGYKDKKTGKHVPGLWEVYIQEEMKKDNREFKDWKHFYTDEHGGTVVYLQLPAPYKPKDVKDPKTGKIRTIGENPPKITSNNSWRMSYVKFILMSKKLGYTMFADEAKVYPLMGGYNGKAICYGNMVYKYTPSADLYEGYSMPEWKFIQWINKQPRNYFTELKGRIEMEEGDLQDLIMAKEESLKGLIETDGAILLVANDLGVEIIEKYKNIGQVPRDLFYRDFTFNHWQTLQVIKKVATK